MKPTLDILRFYKSEKKFVNKVLVGLKRNLDVFGL